MQSSQYPVQKEKSQRLARFSQYMAVATLVLMVLILLINVIYWLWPDFAYSWFGFSFSISIAKMIGVEIIDLLLWQRFGGIVVSSLPLLTLVLAALSLFKLFRLYARKEYFSEQAALYLERVGKFVMLWVILNFLCQPATSYWMTMNAPIGHRMITLGLGSEDIIALFLSACFYIIARILGQASTVYIENQSFV
ncbi:DUF2975 domain-containing protein [Utexia brackfieldae]|uniref:DUF2975 domain-containing protein n=1 Tax=Utexia brackfieldae TaxID=3074108 RepID=UPI00370D4856